MGRNGHAFFMGFLDRNRKVKKSEWLVVSVMNLHGFQLLEMGFIDFFFLTFESSFLVHELSISVIILACEIARGIRLHLVVVPGKGAEAVGIVSLIKHLHCRASDDRIDVPGPTVDVSLLLSVFVENRLYRYRFLFLEESQDGLDGSVAHS